MNSTSNQCTLRHFRNIAKVVIAFFWKWMQLCDGCLMLLHEFTSFWLAIRMSEVRTRETPSSYWNLWCWMRVWRLTGCGICLNQISAAAVAVLIILCTHHYHNNNCLLSWHICIVSWQANGWHGNSCQSCRVYSRTHGRPQGSISWPIWKHQCHPY